MKYEVIAMAAKGFGILERNSNQTKDEVMQWLNYYLNSDTYNTLVLWQGGELTCRYSGKWHGYYSLMCGENMLGGGTYMRKENILKEIESVLGTNL